MRRPATVLWIGTYPPDGLGTPPGKGEGVWRAELAAEGLLAVEQVATIPAPSFVLRHPVLPLVYAVSEDAPAALHVISTDFPYPVVASVELGGAEACHALLGPGERELYVSLYESGELVVVRLDSEGLPEPQAPHARFAYEGSGPRADRQAAPHAHQSVLSPGHSHVLVADLGSDTVWAHSRAADGNLGTASVATRLPAGSGPRHAVVRGELIYLVCELDHQLRTLRWDRASATAEIIAAQPVTLAAHRTGEDVFEAHPVIVAGPQGDVLFVSVRGADVISVFDIAPEGELRYRGAFDTGHWPRHFAIVPGGDGGRLVVTNQRGHEIRTFSLADILAMPPETEAGAVATLPHTSAAVTSPACIAGATHP